MRHSLGTRITAGLLAGAVLVSAAAPLRAQGITSREAEEAIDKAKRYLLKAQRPDGYWGGEASNAWAKGITSMVLLALLNTGMTASDKEIQRGLSWLRRQEGEATMTYEVSLMIQALAAAKDGKRDLGLIRSLANKLERTQIKAGQNAGSWSYGFGGPNGGGDRSNAQFAVLGLREAQEMGVSVGGDVWRRARSHWTGTQNGDGSWSYNTIGAGTGSMTVAGIATLVITEAMVRADQKEIDAQGNPICCGDAAPDDALEKACRWMGNNFSVRQNPGAGMWVLYYLYGLERAGRFSGRRFFISSRGDRHDWYREGAEYLVSQQDRLTGAWRGHGHAEDDPVLGTSFALMFLSKGLAPVLINKLQYGPRGPGNAGAAGNDWNRHPNDARNLTQHITNLDKWPRLLTWQVVEVGQSRLSDLMQAPILFLSGTEAPQFTPQEVALLRDYVLQGGFILAVNGCGSAAFDEGFRDLIRQMYPPSEAQLKLLDASHPVFRSEYPLIDRESGQPSAELWGVDVGCRTSIMYSPDDIACLWDKWTSFDVRSRPRELSTMITKAVKVGVNIVAYVTGREVINKLQQQERFVDDGRVDRIERDLLQLAKVRYTGDWNAAPQALRNLLSGLHRTAGVPTATSHRDLTLVDSNLFKYPLVYMHGRQNFVLSGEEQDRLRQYLKQGGFLFADSCCGAPAFDKSFRDLVARLFPDHPLKRVPPDHELFTTKIGNDLQSVRRREPEVDTGDSALQISVRTVEPFLEGIEIDGRYVVVYSKYDISCALERQSSVACTGYIHEDAVRLGVNIVLYSLLQ